MITRTIAAAVLVLGLAQAALAEDTTSNASSTQSGQANESLPQGLRQKLQEAGYKNVEIVPGSYLVNAQDAQGNKVIMRIGPTSMTVLTEASANSSTTGSGSINDQSQNHTSGSANSPTNSSGGDSTKNGSTK